VLVDLDGNKNGACSLSGPECDHWFSTHECVTLCQVFHAAVSASKPGNSFCACAGHHRASSHRTGAKARHLTAGVLCAELLALECTSETGSRPKTPHNTRGRASCPHHTVPATKVCPTVIQKAAPRHLHQMRLPPDSGNCRSMDALLLPSLQLHQHAEAPHMQPKMQQRGPAPQQVPSVLAAPHTADLCWQHSSAGGTLAAQVPSHSH
jgi:hypothetical protein